MSISSTWLTNDSIKTARLKLRTLQSSDALFLIQLWTNEQVRKHLGGPINKDKAEQKAVEYIDKKGYFVVVEKGSGKTIGICSLDKYRTGDIEVSFEFLPEAWGEGFGKETITEVIKWGFENMAIDHIIAVTQITNTRSRKLLESIGMVAKDEFIEFNEPQIMYLIKASSFK